MDPEKRIQERDSAVFSKPSLPLVKIFLYKEFAVFKWLYYIGWTLAGLNLTFWVWSLVILAFIPNLPDGFKGQGLVSQSPGLSLVMVAFVEAMRLIISCLATMAFDFKDGSG